MITDCDINLDLNSFAAEDISVDNFIRCCELLNSRASYEKDCKSEIGVINQVKELPGFIEFFLKKIPTSTKYPNEPSGLYEFQLYAKFASPDFAIMAKLVL